MAVLEGGRLIARKLSAGDVRRPLRSGRYLVAARIGDTALVAFQRLTAAPMIGQIELAVSCVGGPLVVFTVHGILWLVVVGGDLDLPEGELVLLLVGDLREPLSAIVDIVALMW